MMTQNTELHAFTRQSADKKDKLLTNEYPLIVLPELAKEVGTNAAIVLQQIHYWTQKKCGKVIDGVRWIYNTYKQWQEQLSFLSLSTVKRAIARLKELNLIVVEQHNKSEWNHTNYYAINYKGVEALQLSIGERVGGGILPPPISRSECSDRLGQVEPIDSVNLEPSTISTEKTSENTTHTEVGEKKSFPQEADKLIEKYEDRLKTYGIYRLSWSGDKLVSNPKMEPVLQTLALVPPTQAERSILAFLGWYKTQDANKIRCKYKSLASAISNDWELSQ